jgi:hypothetical protein
VINYSTVINGTITKSEAIVTTPTQLEKIETYVSDTIMIFVLTTRSPPHYANTESNLQVNGQREVSSHGLLVHQL